jgi:sRNA-binding protein
MSRAHRRFPTRLVLAAASAVIISGLGLPTRAEDVKPAAPATQPVDPAVAALVKQLGDADPSVRETATKKLKEIGRPALPALREAARSDDPEVKARATKLVDSAQKRVPAPAPRDAGFGQGHSVSVSIDNGVRTTVVDSEGYRVRTRQDADGITMDVTGVEDGKPVTETYKAKDADEMKREYPEAFALYEKFGGNNANGGIRIEGFGAAGIGIAGGNGRIQVAPGGAGVVVGPGIIQVGPNGVGRADAAAMQRDMLLRQIDRLMEMRLQVETQLDQANVPPEQRDQALRNFDQMIDRMHERLAQLDLQGNPAPAPGERKLDDLREPMREKADKPDPNRADRNKNEDDKGKSSAPEAPKPQ